MISDVANTCNGGGLLWEGVILKRITYNRTKNKDEYVRHRQYRNLNETWVITFERVCFKRVLRLEWVRVHLLRSAVEHGRLHLERVLLQPVKTNNLYHHNVLIWGLFSLLKQRAGLVTWGWTQISTRAFALWNTSRILVTCFILKRDNSLTCRESYSTTSF